MEPSKLDAARQARIDELCHLMTMCDTRDVRVCLCAELKRAIKALNDERLARLEEAFRTVAH
ncbi:hypothetical protein [Caballeronia sp. LZ035]|uniref:hypothetical protein n=1 Tax=Caballeronia sp. LZ035 TaxID=3038568 RepID=UPI0028638B80|nr:hypothetical protein [Caballeronia sp. LZ035]MDR5756999.1 hypothetical protein [Caballeronia sp. LZ035]